MKEDRLRLYLDYMVTISLSFAHCKFTHLLREGNQIVDALNTLASVWESVEPTEVKPFILVKSQTPFYVEIRVMSVRTTERP